MGQNQPLFDDFQSFLNTTGFWREENSKMTLVSLRNKKRMLSASVRLDVGTYLVTPTIPKALWLRSWMSFQTAIPWSSSEEGNEEAHQLTNKSGFNPSWTVSNVLVYFKWAFPASFRLFYKQTIQLLQQINAKNVHPVYAVGIRTHGLRNVRLLNY